VKREGGHGHHNDHCSVPDGSLDDYIATVQKTFGANYTPDDVYAGDYFSALGAIDSGVTCILDWLVAGLVALALPRLAISCRTRRRRLYRWAQLRETCKSHGRSQTGDGQTPVGQRGVRLKKSNLRSRPDAS
jgi:hypothetical protein